MTDDLDDLLAEARAQRPAPSPALMARVLADAEAAARARAPRPAPARAAWRALGGWPALGALLASTVLGVGVGAAEPAALSGVTGVVTELVWGEAVSVAVGADEDPLSLLEG